MTGAAKKRRTFESFGSLFDISDFVEVRNKRNKSSKFLIKLIIVASDPNFLCPEELRTTLQIEGF